MNDIEVDSDVSEHGIDTVQKHTMQENEHATLKSNNTSVQLKLYSGTETNILTHHDFLKVIPERQLNTKLERTTAKLTAFGGDNIPVLGKCYLCCQYNNVTQIFEFHVVESGTSLLGCTNCKIILQDYIIPQRESTQQRRIKSQDDNKHTHRANT